MDLRRPAPRRCSSRNGSFSAAGHELNGGQPMISKRVGELEDELGILLFDRATSGARLMAKAVLETGRHRPRFFRPPAKRLPPSLPIFTPASPRRRRLGVL